MTGHSKGGALSTTLALWLADTQGGAPVPEADRWDPLRKATVCAYSFAGPTAGNEEFASHSNAVIGPRCYRIVNHLDVVPHAWASSDMQEIPGLYGPPDGDRAMLKGLIDEVIKTIGPLNYHHVGNNVTQLSGVLKPETPFVLQLVHQHLDGYLEQMGLGNEMNTATFFAPVVGRPSLIQGR